MRCKVKVEVHCSVSGCTIIQAAPLKFFFFFWIEGMFCDNYSDSGMKVWYVRDECVSRTMSLALVKNALGHQDSLCFDFCKEWHEMLRCTGGQCFLELKCS